MGSKTRNNMAATYNTSIYAKYIGGGEEIPVLVSGVKFNAYQFPGKMLGEKGDMLEGFVLINENELTPENCLFQVGSEVRYTQDFKKFTLGVVTGYTNAFDGRLGYLIFNGKHEGGVLREEVFLR